MATVTQDVKQPKLRAPNVDLHGLAKAQLADELATRKQDRDLMQSKNAPVINKYCAEDSFPFDLLPAIKELNVMDAALPGFGYRGGSALLFALVVMEKVRIDASIATFKGIHSGLAMNAIDFAGLEERKKKWLPPIDLELDFKNRALYWTDCGDPPRGNTVKSRLDRRQSLAGNRDE
jgi:alkylation response protein AidB-like acyl-CoA dehydrogenase